MTGDNEAGAPMRHWCALIQFPDKKPLIYGTVFARHGAPEHEVEQALRASITQHLPDGWTLKSMLPGAIFFVPEGEA
ncbi:hypothetical protein AncyloWKF20_05665 [Ancylobacter sp. WKF20]|uniref:hypothetical protein n=1 Tax=Ancylobacter sp. WKF20 TaxID=3039801 RepID=UPI0024345C50|nr:hypothetical protein [Ancylobacter sp. WKF20]WGD31313.1 hypothetical protein AncyloWKF20_05665 [Ancylobacter sp. WKF20]